MIPLLGFTPDVDTTTPGVITDCSHLIPSERGMVSAPSPVNVTVDVLADDCRGAAVLTNTSGTRRTFAGAQTRLYEQNGTAWSDVSSVTYTGSSENRWMFAQFGNVALAVNDTEPIQQSTTGTFAAIPGTPDARIIITVPNFAIVFDTNDATYGDSPDRWWCCAYQDYTSWTASVTTQATTGRLIGDGGAITAGARFGQGAVAYKTRSMFLGTYVGPPVVWQWDQIPGDVGCVGPEAVTDIGGAHVFVGEDNIYLYDGTRPVPISQGSVREWFYKDSNSTYRYRTIVTYDKHNGRVWIFYPSTNSTDGTPDSALVYHVGTKKWGRSNRTVEAVVNYVASGLTWDTLNTLSSTWDALPSNPWDSPTWQAGARALAIFNGSHQLQTITGAGSDSGLTLGAYGDDFAMSTLQGFRLRFITAPTTASSTAFHKDGAGSSYTTGDTISIADSKFDFRHTANFHSANFRFTGDVEVSAVAPQTVKAGYR